MTAFGQPTRHHRRALLAAVGCVGLVAGSVHSSEGPTNRAEPIAEIHLPFRPASLALSEDGHDAAVWETYSGTAGPVGTGGPRLCLVDLKAQRVAGQRELNHRIVAVTVGARAVLVLYGETIQVLRRTDLLPVASIVLSRPAADLILVDDQWLFVRQPRSWNVLRLPERAESPLLRALLADPRGADLLPPVVPVSGGWQVGPAVLDATLQQVQFFRSLRQLAHTELLSRPSGWEPTASAPGRRQFALQKRVHGPVSLADGVNVSATAKQEQTDQGDATSVVVEATRADGRQTTFPPCRLAGNVTQVALLCAGRTVAFLAGDRLCVVELGERGSALPQPSARLSVHPQPGTLVLSPRQDTVISYAISGGRGPYVVRPAAQREPMRVELQDLAVEGEQPHSLVVDGVRVTEAASEDHLGLSLAAKICERVNARGGQSAADVVAAYIDQANHSLAPYVARTFRDVPVAVAVGVTVTDAAATSVSLSHDMILELPQARMVAFVGRELLRRSPEARRADAWMDAAASRLPAIELPLLWPADAGPAFLSELTRRTWPPVALPQEALPSLAAMTCLRNLDADFKFSPVTHPRDDPRPERTWKTRTGRTLTGRLTEVVGGNVSIAGPAASGLVPPDQLDAAALRWAWQDISRFQRTDAAYEKRKMWLIGRALHAYYIDHGCFPPPALVAADGRPLLSWRVLLLPYLGHAGLLRLFRLTEPWDSEHNRQLLPVMPLLYTTTEQPLDPGQSNVVALVGPQTAFPPRALRRLSDFTDPPEETLVIVDVVEQGAVPWTQPADLELFGGSRDFQRLYQRTVSRVSGEPAVPRCTGIFADGAVAYFARQFTPDLLLNAARVDDGQWGGLRLDDRR